MSYKLKKTLVSWATGDSQRTDELRVARDECIAKVLSGKGSQITSATTNNNTFTMAIGMSNESFAAMLDDVLNHLTAGTKPINRVVGGFRCE